jgi:multiple sugar transport system substrate-binding protein
MRSLITHLHPFNNILLALFAVGCLTYCGATAPTEAPAEPAPSSPDTPVKAPLNMWIATNKNLTEIQAMVEQSSQETGLGVEFTFTNPEMILPALQNPNPPDLIVLSTNSPIAFYASSGLLMDLSAYFDQGAFFPALVDACSLNGQLFCLPWGADFQVLVWNKDLFDAATLDPEVPPASLEQLSDFADLLTKFGPEGQLEQLGFLPILSIQQTNVIVRMFGGYWISEDGLQITANNPQVQEALVWEQQFYFKYNYENVAALFPYAISLDSYEHPFYAEKLAMVIADWDQSRPDFVASRNPELNFGVAPIPPSSSLKTGSNPVLVDGVVFIVPANSDNPEQAIKLLKVLTTPDLALQAAALIGQFPATPAAINDPTIQANENTPLFAEILNNSQGVTALTTPLSPELDSALLQIGELVLYQGVDPAALLNQIQAEFGPRLEQMTHP